MRGSTLTATLALIAVTASGCRQTHSATGSPSGVVTATFADTGRTITLHLGQRLTVLLDSTYWSLASPTDPSVLAPVAAPVVSPVPPGPGGCVPGGGCGTVSATYRAQANGTSIVSAARASCGEALRCTGNAGTFTVTVIVTG